MENEKNEPDPDWLTEIVGFPACSAVYGAGAEALGHCEIVRLEIYRERHLVSGR